MHIDMVSYILAKLTYQFQFFLQIAHDFLDKWSHCLQIKTVVQSTFFSCFSILARMSSRLLNRNGANEHPCFIPDFGRKAFCPSIKYNGSYWFFTECPFFRLKMFHSQLLRVFIRNVRFVDAFSASIKLIIQFFFFSLIW